MLLGSEYEAEESSQPKERIKQLILYLHLQSGCRQRMLVFVRDLTFGLGTVSSRTGVRLCLRFHLVKQRLPEPGEIQSEVVVLAPGGLGQVGQELA